MSFPVSLYLRWSHVKENLMKRSVPVISIILSLSWVGCSSAPVYLTNRATTPLFSNVHEAKVSASIDPMLMTDFHAAYAPTDHLGILASYKGPTIVSSYAGHFVEIGAGYFNKIGRLGRYGTYAGIGRGWGRADSSRSPMAAPSNDDNATQTYFNFNRYFLEGEIGLVDDGYELGFAARFSNVRLNSYSKYLLQPSSPSKTLITSLPGGQDLFFEPIFFWRAGFGNFQFEQQIIAVRRLLHSPLEAASGNVTFGLSWKFNYP